MKIIFFWLVLLITPKLFGQKIKGQILDKETNTPLPFVQIGVANKNLGTLSDEDGFFIINSSKLNDSDTLIFHYIGYEKIKKSIAIIKTSHLKIYLRKTVYALPEINIKGSSLTKNKFFGYKKTNSKNQITGWTLFDVTSMENPIGERGSLIKIKGKTALLKSMNFHIANNEYDSVQFRIHLYSIKNNLPHKEITPTNIFIKTIKKFGWIKVPLNHLNIIVEEDIIATVEWVKAWKEKPPENIGLHLSVGLFGGFYARDYRHQSYWKTYKIGHTGIFLTAKTN